MSSKGSIGSKLNKDEIDVWQLLTEDVNMEEMLQLKLWINKSQKREFVKVVLYPRGYIIKATQYDIEDFCNRAIWVDKLLRKESIGYFKCRIE